MFKRYAVFYTPIGPLASFGAAWLGWDSATGAFVAHPEVPDIDVAAVTARPRKYGCHATLVAPFRPAPTTDLTQIEQSAEAFAACHAPAPIGKLALRHDHGFLALRPVTQSAALSNLAAELVQAFNLLRAPLTAEDITRRRRARLSARQDQQMLDWGYPFVFDDFHFHITLSGRIAGAAADGVLDALEPRLLPLLEHDYAVEAITLMGEDEAGMFHQIKRFALRG
ncbi:putative xylose isomerase [Sulfitobacter noctilucae]|uniref:DUF1045 domain-containing protein n=1 Tax=Sulfitobacter noctilucae TaxID=1342302 RepID=UPI0004696DA4|nr:DUF1045 domain-containing protein [Sulfitobacter noctilucae]KIN60545.1 putative xylose isomerase [Sulfitobacter noctilucae]